MDPASTAAIVAVTVSVIGGLTSGYAALRQRKTEDMTVVVGAMRDHMQTLRAENEDLRARLRTAESRITDLTAAVTRCEADKDTLTRRLDDLKRQVNGGSQ